MGIIKLDFSRIVGTSKDIKPNLPLKADIGVVFFEQDTEDLYYWGGILVGWILYSRAFKYYGTTFVGLTDTPSTITPNQMLVGNEEGDALIFVPIPTGSTSTGLERINEGNGNGWRLIGKDPAYYGNIGLGAVDFSESTDNTGTMGAIGEYSFATGLNNKNVPAYSTVFGDVNIFNTGAQQYGNHFVAGYNNTITSIYYTATNHILGTWNTSGGWGNKILGNYNDVNASLTNGAAANFVTGEKNYVRGYYTSVLGVGHNLTSASYTTVLGLASNTLAENGTGNTTVERTLLLIGNGHVDGNRNVLSRNDAFKVMYSGLVTAPSLTNTIISTQVNTSKVLITKDFLTTNYPTEAPSDNILYGRRDKTWVAIPSVSTPVTSVFTRTGAITAQAEDYSAFYGAISDVQANTSKVSFPEAPADGSEYVRKNNGWAVASGSTSDILVEKFEGTITASPGIVSFDIPYGGNIVNIYARVSIFVHNITDPNGGASSKVFVQTINQYAPTGVIGTEQEIASFTGGAFPTISIVNSSEIGYTNTKVLLSNLDDTENYTYTVVVEYMKLDILN